MSDLAFLRLQITCSYEYLLCCVRLFVIQRNDKYTGVCHTEESSVCHAENSSVYINFKKYGSGCWLNPHSAKILSEDFMIVIATGLIPLSPLSIVS